MTLTFEVQVAMNVEKKGLTTLIRTDRL